MEIVVIIIIVIIVVVVVMAVTPTNYGKAKNNEAEVRKIFEGNKEKYKPEFQRELSDLCAKYGEVTKDIDIYPCLPFASEFSGVSLGLSGFNEVGFDPKNFANEEWILNAVKQGTFDVEILKVLVPVYVVKSTKSNEVFFSFEATSNVLFEAINNKILVFEENSTIVIKNNAYKFDDIVNFDVYDNSTSIYSGASSSSTKTGSMLGRSAVGAVLFGGVGAIVGGTTAKQEMVTSQTSVTLHNYDVVLTLNSLSTPTLKVNFENNQGKVQEFVSILSIILERRNK